MCWIVNAIKFTWFRPQAKPRISSDTDERDATPNTHSAGVH